MPKFECTLFTSILPRTTRFVHGQDFGPAWQTACIESWRGAGFRVVSLNAQEEIKGLRSFSSTVEFMKIPKGRTRPLISDFFSAASVSGSRIAGIINADCMMIPQIGIAKHLTDHLDGIVIAERLNLSQDTFQLTGKSYGFDAFFFEVAALTAIERDDHWRIGDVWYDYWLPLAFHVAGFEIKTLPAPVLLHLNHDGAWDWSDIERQFPTLINFLRAHADHIDRNLVADLPMAHKLRTEDIRRLHDLFYTWLTSRKLLWHPEAGSVENLMACLLNAPARPPQPPVYRAVFRQARALLRRVIDTIGLRRTFYALGLVKRREQMK